MTAVPELVTLSTQNNYLDDGRNHVSGNDIRKVIKLQHSEVIGDPEVLDNPESEDEGRFNANMNSVSDDEVGPVLAIKKRTQRFSDSDSNANDSGKSVECPIDKEDYEQNPDRDNSNTSKDIKKTRIKKMDSSDSENNSSDNSIDHERSVDIRKSVRREDKQSSLKDKFKSLLSNKNTLKMSSEDEDNGKHHSNSEHSDDEFSCLKIKQKVKSATQAMKSICDPDTSDEEDNSHNKPSKRKSKPKMTKPTSPKPMRMTAKQAMENMQKIKSESNRMLREKGVSLPYHRPKALTLKDIMNRRKPAVSSDGKTLPIKMNEEQLRQYAMLLEQRQKEVIELCKSDTDEEEKEDEINDETNEEKTAVNENNLISTKPITNIEQSTESISNHGMENEHSHVESCMEDDGVNGNEKPPESSEPLEVAMETDPSNKNVGNPICGDVTEKGDECIETELQENILLQNKVAEESQNIMLHYESEKINMNDMDLQTKNGIEDVEIEKGDEDKEDDLMKEDDISDCDINIDEIDKIIEEAEINCDKSVSNKSTPKLTGAPGILINLDDEETEPRKLSGVELLKERFTFFAKIKTMEDMEKDREKKFKPGTQHLKLKQELEEQIAEQRSLEWEKRLQEEKQLKSEIYGENDEDDIEKLESKLEEIDKEEIENEEDSSESEEELLENDVMEDKPKRRNPMVDDEAEISDDDDDGKGEALVDDAGAENESDEESDTDESSSDSEDESKPRKGRILKAFEDSDDEKENEETIIDNADIIPEATIELEAVNGDAIITESQDDELPLAQMYKSSDDLFSTQSTDPGTAALNKNTQDNSSVELVSQTICLSNPDLSKMIKMDINPDNMNVCGTQSDDVSMDGIVGMCSGSFTQNLVSSQMLPPPLTQSQDFGDDIATMCTGKFYENPLVSQESITQEFEDKSRDIERDTSLHDAENISQNEENHTNNKYVPNNMKDENKENTILNSILDELDDLDDKPKQNKYFASGAESKDLKKKFTIDSDDETNETSPKKLKKFKKKRAEKRALQISDDEEDELSDVESEIVEDGDDDRVVEYDSEENEIEVMQPNAKQPKKSIRNFFENEAELSSEDEWIGSGDEDERGLDMMEREEGDDETFHQGQLRRELGQIHMREVLDQDKREVRLIQELLFEDGDLGDGHRQRKFRWRNADGEEETGTYPEQFADTQEEEFESEEQWRKERHEREMFIRKMREKDEEEKNISINRNTIIKANLSSRSMSTLISETKTGKTVEKPVTEKKTSKDIPSPKKGFTIFQQNYHTSMLTRGRGALARLAALATPLADDDAPRNISKNRGNFVFTAITPDDKPKVTIKRKAEKIHTPRLIKKLKTDDSNIRKPSLFDHIKT